MVIVHVFVRVRPGCADEFIEATRANARNSLREPGVARFDVLRRPDDPDRFVLMEVYRTPDDPARHKETEHYKAWRDSVEPMMAEPRTSIRYENVFPDESGWDSFHAV